MTSMPSVLNASMAYAAFPYSIADSARLSCSFGCLYFCQPICILVSLPIIVYDHDHLY